MSRYALAIAIVVATALAMPVAAAAFTGPVLTPAEVVEIDRSRDGAVLTVEGEAIGEHLRAVGGGRWVNILGDEVGLGVWVTDEMAARIEYFGDYGHDGDIVRFTGALNVSCERHGGEFDVHAERMEIIATGGLREHDVDLRKGAVGLAGIAVAFVLWMWYRRRRDRRMI